MPNAEDTENQVTPARLRADAQPPSLWRSLLRRLGRSSALVLFAALLFLAGVVINLFSSAVEEPLKQSLGASSYARVLFGAMGVCLLLAVAALGSAPATGAVFVMLTKGIEL